MMQTTWPGRYYDGRTAAAEEVTLEPSPTGLRIERAGGSTLWWPWNEVWQTQGSHRGDPVRLERGGEPAEAVVADDQGLLDAIHEIAPEEGRRFHYPARRSRNILFVTVGALVALAVGGVLYVWGIPRLAARVAARVPVSWEEQLGQQVRDQLATGAARCEDSLVLGAVDEIVSRLGSALPERRYRFRVTVVNTDVINAFAAPGGYVVVQRGLLAHTARPEELAGVLAHEMEHVALRHGTQAILREVPVRLVLGAASGDMSGLGGVAGTLSTLGVLRYQRGDEDAADREGLRLLRRARVDPRGMVSFFETLRRESGDVPRGLDYFTTHPRTGERIARLQRLAQQDSVPTVPFRSAERWGEIARGCGPGRPS